MVLMLSMGSPEQSTWTGQIAVKGNEPFTFLALTDTTGHEWQLSGPSVATLRASAQGNWVRIQGKIKGQDTIEVESWTLAQPPSP
jgi:hypothetical protein